MKEENKLTKLKKILLDNPIIGTIVIVLLIIQIIPTMLTPIGRINDELYFAVYILSTIVIYYFFRKKNQDKMPKFNYGKGILKGLFLAWPAWVLFGVVSLLSKINANGGINFNAYHLFAAIMAALSAGVNEEIGSRALTIDNAYRVQGEIKIYIYLILTSIIFGLSHITNIFFGASLSATISQIFYATGFGILFGAIYLRTGNILPGIISHFIIDFASAFNPAYDPSSTEKMMLHTEEVNVVQSLIQIIIIGGILALYGLFLVRKKKHDEITEVWSK